MSDVIAPASVPQELFLNSDDVDIVFYGCWRIEGCYKQRRI